MYRNVDSTSRNLTMPMSSCRFRRFQHSIYRIGYLLDCVQISGTNILYVKLFSFRLLLADVQQLHEGRGIKLNVCGERLNRFSPARWRLNTHGDESVAE